MWASSDINTVIVRRNESNGGIYVERLPPLYATGRDFRSSSDFYNAQNHTVPEDIFHPILVALTHAIITGDGLPTDLEEEKNKLSEDEFINLETCSELTNCAICMENKKMNVKLKCNHIFCKTCIKKWLTEKSNTCPNCRTEI